MLYSTQVFNLLLQFKILNNQTPVQIKKIIPVDTPNVPNRMILEISFPEDENWKIPKEIDAWMMKLADRLKERVADEFRAICDTIFAKCNISNITQKDVLWEQLKNFPETYWAFHEYRNQISDFEELGLKLQSAKQLRIFSQTKEPAARKCALFPEYNALFYKGKDGKKLQFIDKQAVELGVEPDDKFYALKPGEGLCTLAFIKRMFYLAERKNYNEQIISVASMLLKNRLNSNSEAKVLLRKLSPEAAEAVFDCQNGLALKEEEYKEKDCEAAQALFEHMKGQKLFVSPYYAVIKFDGDEIGALYRKCTSEQQQALSEKIGDYARNVADVMKKYGGMCIYAGGEDFMGFFPVEGAIPALCEMRQMFQEKVTPPGDKTEKLTISAGMVFAHLMPPLKNVLSTADDMELFAKSNPNKDSFAISLARRSGKETRVRFRFGEDCESLNTLAEISEHIQAERLSSSSVYALITILEELANPSKEMVKVLIVQNITDTKIKGEKKKENEKNIEMLNCLFEHCNHDTAAFISAMEIAAFLGREGKTCTIK